MRQILLFVMSYGLTAAVDIVLSKNRDQPLHSSNYCRVFELIGKQLLIRTAVQRMIKFVLIANSGQQCARLSGEAWDILVINIARNNPYLLLRINDRDFMAYLRLHPVH